MSKKYPHIVLAEPSSIKLMDAEAVALVKRLTHISQSGFGYLKNDSNAVVGVVLQSDTMHDVLDCIRNQAWAHSSNPSQVKKGMEVYVVPSKPSQTRYGIGAVGVKFVAAEDVYKDINNEFVWASE